MFFLNPFLPNRANTLIRKRKKFDSLMLWCKFICHVCGNKDSNVCSYSALGRVYSGYFEQCFFCKAMCCRKCNYTYIYGYRAHLIFRRFRRSDIISWDCIRIILIARYKEESSPFYKKKLPFCLLKMILIQIQQIRCLECTRGYTFW